VSKINGINLSGILYYQITEVVTNIENNIKLHFLDYLKRFVNSSFKKQNQQILKNLKGKEKIETKKTLAKELYQIKNDLLNNTLECDNKYHNWLTLHRNKVIPPKINTHYQVDIQKDPQKFIKYMIYMNVHLEKINAKQYQFFPLRSSIIPKYCPIDTKSIIEIFVENNKNKYLLNIDKYKRELWSVKKQSFLIYLYYQR
jgi:hypothetical protein